MAHVPSADINYKWPNDVMIRWQKLAGILVEYVDGTYIIGIGLNVKQPAGMDEKLKKTTTSLGAAGYDQDRLIMTLGHIIRNAQEATPNTGFVDVTLRQEGNNAINNHRQ